MKRGTIIWGAVGLVVLAILGGLGFVWSEETAFHDRASQLRAEGEPLTFEDFVEPVRDEDNAAVVFDELGATVSPEALVELDADSARALAATWDERIDAALARPYYRPHSFIKNTHHLVAIVLSVRKDPADVVRLLTWGHKHEGGLLLAPRQVRYLLAFSVIRFHARAKTLPDPVARRCVELLDDVAEVHVPSKWIRAQRNLLADRILQWERGEVRLLHGLPPFVPQRVLIYRDVNGVLELLDDALRWCDPPTAEAERKAIRLHPGDTYDTFAGPHYAASIPTYALRTSLDGIRETRMIRRLLLHTLGETTPLPTDPRTEQPVTQAEWDKWLASGAEPDEEE
ncbi:MAG: hypothetical protein OER88_10130 [Planctomycetota bacterium]|nr:hypothetical protein [Planctomycetota bacterium]